MIAASNVSLRVGGRGLLDGITFGARAGEFIAIVGPNGVGKTTLMRAIAGLHPVSQGSLHVMGRPVGGYAPTERARTIAFVVSDEVPVEAMTVREAVAAGRFAHHRWWEWRENQTDALVIEQALRAVELSGVAERNFLELSSGQRQRVWLALGLAQQAPIMLLDEPTSHLDVRASQEILHLLRAQAGAQTALACVLHDMNEALEFADRILVLAHGGMLAYEEPEEIVRQNVLERAYGISLEPVRTPSGRLRVFARRGGIYPHDR
ncbi:MAG: ATP-binding cassette domain-containing protein [Vulcanimicrobiaceae bacterium]